MDRRARIRWNDNGEEMDVVFRAEEYDESKDFRNDDDIFFYGWTPEVSDNIDGTKEFGWSREEWTVIKVYKWEDEK